MKKQATAFILVLALLACCAGAFAAGGEQSYPEEKAVLRYEDFSRITPALSVSGKTATYSLEVRGLADVTRMSAVLQIQKQNSNGTYSNYGDPWSASSASNYLNTSGTKSVDSGGTYRLRVTVTPYMGSVKGQAETAYS